MQVKNFPADQDAVVQHRLLKRAAGMNTRREVHCRYDIFDHGEVCRSGISVNRKDDIGNKIPFVDRFEGAPFFNNPVEAIAADEQGQRPVLRREAQKVGTRTPPRRT